MMEKTGVQKSNFSVTCSLLSQYLKEKGRIGELGGFDMVPRPLDQKTKGKLKAPTTMSLLPGVDVSGENTEDIAEQNATNSVDLFPQHAGFQSSTITTSAKDTDKVSGIKELQKSQMTIFYGGKVLVFDNFPAEKAKGLMQMASKESNSAAQNFMFKAPSSIPNSSMKPANASDMPIARRNSLHRFLEKRKDRISTKAPYQVHAGSTVAAPEDSYAWLGLGPKIPKPELNSSIQ